MQVYNDSTGLYWDSQQKTNPSQTLDKDAFMKILVSQLRYQNPLSPQDSESFINQIVQLSTMEQIANMTASMNRLMEAEEFSRAVSLIGYEVTVLNKDGETVDGTVEKVTMANGQPCLVIDDGEYSMNSLVYIRRPEPEPPAEIPDPQDTETPEQISDAQDEPGAAAQQDTGTSDVMGGQ